MNIRVPQPKKGNLWIGAAYHYYSRLSFYFSIPSILMLAATFWHTTGSVYIGIPIYVMVLIMITGVSLTVAFEYFFATPAVMAYSNKIVQEQNPVLAELVTLKQEVQELKEMIKNNQITDK